MVFPFQEVHDRDMELREPSLEWKESFTAALAEFDTAGITGFWNWRFTIVDIPSYIAHTEECSRGENLPEGSVPSSTFWLIDNDEFIGHVNIRHRLNDQLEIIGGHIGYAIRPGRQAMGYGMQILKLALSRAKALGIDRALVTCNTDNVASRRIIEKNGGELQDEITVDGKPVLRFWISLSA